MFTKRQLRKVLDTIYPYRFDEYDLNRLYNECKRAGNHILTPIIPNTYVESDAAYKEEDIEEELKRLSDDVIHLMFIRSENYYKELPSKWFDVLLKSRKDIKAYIVENPNLITNAAYTGFKEMMGYFITIGLNINVCVMGNTPIGQAARGGHAEVVKMLLDAGATTNEKTLEYAVRSKEPEVVELILKTGVKVTDGIASVAAVSNGNPRVIKLLIAAGANYSEGNAAKALIGAVKAGNLHLVGILLEAGADPCVEGYSLLNYSYHKTKSRQENRIATYGAIYTLLERYLEKKIIDEYKLKEEQRTRKI